MKRILVDVDGVCADFMGHLLNRLNIPDRQIPSWSFKDFLTPSEKAEAEKILATEEFCASIPVIDFAITSVQHLQNTNHDIVFVTSPWIRNRTWEATRREWLEKHFGSYVKLISTDLKYMVRGDYLIDDKPSHIKEWQSCHNGRAILFDQTWNHSFDWPFRMRWAAIVSTIKQDNEEVRRDAA